MAATTGTTILEVTLEDPSQEEQFLVWWDGVRALAVERFRSTECALLVLGRGDYMASVGFALPGIWQLMTRSQRWTELEGQRPAAHLHVTQTRRWHRTGAPRDITTSELRALVEKGDVILLDARPIDAYHEGHLPGALPLGDALPDEAMLTSLIGRDMQRPLVTYCSGYG